MAQRQLVGGRLRSEERRAANFTAGSPERGAKRQRSGAVGSREKAAPHDQNRSARRGPGGVGLAERVGIPKLSRARKQGVLGAEKAGVRSASLANRNRWGSGPQERAPRCRPRVSRPGKPARPKAAVGRSIVSLGISEGSLGEPEAVLGSGSPERSPDGDSWGSLGGGIGSTPTTYGGRGASARKMQGVSPRLRSLGRRIARRSKLGRQRVSSVPKEAQFGVGMSPTKAP